MKIRLLLVVLCVFALSCATKETKPYTLPENARFLIAGDSVKTWKIAKRYNGKARMNMGDCFLGYRQRFRESGFVKDNNAQMSNCGPSLEATWEITTSDEGHSFIKFTSDQLPELLGQEDTFKYFKVVYVSKDSLTLRYWHTQFAEKRIITDYLVREDLEVADRQFHW